MALPSLTGLPLELRERIYSSLLTFTPTSTSTSAPASPLCTLLTLNRQIHTEIITYLKSHLLVLLTTNDPEFIEKTLAPIWGHTTSIPILSQLRSLDGTVNKNPANAPIAMELEFYMFMSSKEATSSAAFLLPAASLKDMADAQGGPDFYIWTMQALLSAKLRDTFSHARDAAETALLLQPYTTGFLRPSFVGVATAGVTPETTQLLRRKLRGDYEAAGHLKKLRSLMHAAVDGAQDDWGAAAGRFNMARRYAEMLWENHEACLAGDASFDGVHHLWLMHSDVCAMYVQVLLNVASGASIGIVPTGNREDGNEAFVEVRRVAEEVIAFLRQMPEWGRPETAGLKQGVVGLSALRKIKAKISFRAYLVCKGMGDVDAAVGYLKEALKYEPETSEKLLGKIEELKEEGAGDGEGMQGVVKWE
jgi:hypothetical protein